MHCCILQIVAILGFLGSATGHGDCPSSRDWNELRNLCWRQSYTEMTFHQAVDYCITNDYQDGPGSNIMSVSMLRNFKNRYDRHDHHRLRVDFEDQNGPFIVNGIKSTCGGWREYPSGRLVNFNHFPHFHVQKGEPGDTLIWDPIKNELLTSDGNAQHRVLCYRPPSLDNCENCRGFELGNECNGAGDCELGVCHCDEGFTGDMCQHRDRNNVELVIIGQDGDRNAWLYNFETNTTCQIANIPESSDFGVGAYFNGQAHYCNTMSSRCYIYSENSNMWLEVADMNQEREYAGFALVPTRTSSDPSSPQYGGNGENDDWPVDYSWWATGGFTSSLVPSNTTEIYQHGRWDSAEIEPCDSDILLPEGVGLATQCAVQINAYETAIIGGVDANGKVNNDILVYNWRERIWRIAGSAPTVDVTKQGCGLITDPITGRVNVLVTGGTTGPAGASVDVASTWIWDPITGQIKRMPDVPINVIAGNNLKVVEYNSYEDLVLQPDTGILYKFSIENGWTPISNQTPNLQDPAVFLVPKGLFKCI